MTQASIFLVEDEALIRMMLVEMVEELGHRVVAEAGNVDDGRSLAEIEGYDLAILDINLQGTNVQPVAQVVRSRGLPLIFLSGYGTKGLPDGFEGMPVLLKPCTPDTLKRTIDAVLPNVQPEKRKTSIAEHRRS
ncbi:MULTISPECIES: response regulator [unclassified Bradyrhizobium]|uniref:response regulator n=1 Tax=unclassified Bradyrhizobium TaxID=2631580 RepID=UPI003393A9B6